MRNATIILNWEGRLSVRRRLDELAVAEDQAGVEAILLSDHVLHERGVRVSGGEVIGEVVVDRVLVLPGEGIEIDPGVGILRLKDEYVVFAAHAVRPDALLHGLFRTHVDRIKQPPGAEANVGEPASVFGFDFEEHVGARPYFGRTETDSRRQATQGESERLEHGGEKRVMLKAIAAASRGHELRLQIAQVERDAATEHDIQVFERNGRDVREVQRLERLGCRVEDSVVADAREIRYEVEPGLSLAGGMFDGHRRLCPNGGFTHQPLAE